MHSKQSQGTSLTWISHYVKLELSAADVHTFSRGTAVHGGGISRREYGGLSKDEGMSVQSDKANVQTGHPRPRGGDCQPLICRLHL